MPTVVVCSADCMPSLLYIIIIWHRLFLGVKKAEPILATSYVCPEVNWWPMLSEMLDWS